MDEFANLSADKLKPYFAIARDQTKLDDFIIEKDFWVCWILKRLFGLDDLKDHLIFKGGTSLSKAYGLIHRFSEDIDLSIDRTYLGFVDEKDPATKSREKREKLLKDLRDATQKFVRNELFQQLKDNFSDHLRKDLDWALTVDPDDPDQQSLLFRYPSIAARGEFAYLKQEIKLEFGSRGELWPSKKRKVTSILAEKIPDAMSEPEIEVTTLDAVRTFWEKATILHKLHYWPADKALPTHHSRHYYDIYCILGARDPSEFFESVELLEKVAEHKRLFFRSSAARYELAKRGTLRLKPSAAIANMLHGDYESMSNMIFGEPPAWSDIVERIASFEESFNH